MGFCVSQVLPVGFCYLRVCGLGDMAGVSAGVNGCDEGHSVLQIGIIGSRHGQSEVAIIASSQACRYCGRVRIDFSLKFTKGRRCRLPNNLSESWVGEGETCRVGHFDEFL